MALKSPQGERGGSYLAQFAFKFSLRCGPSHQVNSDKGQIAKAEKLLKEVKAEATPSFTKCILAPVRLSRSLGPCLPRHFSVRVYRSEMEVKCILPIAKSKALGPYGA